MYDIEFLNKLDKLHNKITHCRISLLTFDEELITTIEGLVTQGSLSNNISSNIRRSINFSMAADKKYAEIENINNLISINKKIKVEIGLENPLKEYQDYGSIIWFNQGVFVISTASVQCSTTSFNISITAKDKMVMLNGVAGGTLPSTVRFHEVEIQQANGEILIEHPTILRIIREAVHHYGGEPLNKIFINDLDDTAKWLMKYNGSNNLYLLFQDAIEIAGITFNMVEAENFYKNKNKPEKYIYSKGEDIGYELTDFTYPGELIFAAGNKVTDLLDKIIQALGNYEYFYDIDGNFIFQKKKNYLDDLSPINELVPAHYVSSYSNTKAMYNITNDLYTSITVNPKYDNIKNDFIVWGKKKTGDNEVPIWYHLAIDEKPQIDLANKYLWQIDTAYFVTETSNKPADNATLIGGPCNEWREELYRQALIAEDGYSDYDAELLANWRNLYDPCNEAWIDHWNPAVKNDPQSLIYWLDFIDVNTDLMKYSVKSIGRRTEVKNDDNVSYLMANHIPDVIFIENSEAGKSELCRLLDVQGEDQAAAHAYLRQTGQAYCYLNPSVYGLFRYSSTGVSAIDDIRDMMYQHLTYNTTINITCIPIYYLESNNIIHIIDNDVGSNGNYLINSFTLPLTYSGMMSIIASEVLLRV